jgi:predicted CxxxxCH...CXXCH cytochrome family protein
VGGTYANAMSCQTCHPTVGTYTTTHANGVSNVAFTGAASANLQKGTWKAGTGTAAGTCASTWCHGAVVQRGTSSAGGTNITPAWNATITACTACHGSPPNTGDHTSNHHQVACSYCHGGTYTSTVADKTRHVNGVTEVNGARIRTWNAATRSCTPTCHSSKTW